MSGSLVKFVNGGVVFTEAVARIAESLSPLGGAARLVAESAACVVAMRELSVEGRRVEADVEVRLAQLASRRAESSSSLRTLREQMGHAELTAQVRRQLLVDLNRGVLRHGGSLEEKKVYQELIDGLSRVLLEHHSQQGSDVVTLADTILNGAGATGLYGVAPRRDARPVASPPGPRKPRRPRDRRAGH